MAYAEDRGECYYTEQLGMDFLKEFFGVTQEDFSRTLPQAETQEIRVIRMVGDARADTELKRKALENAYPDLVDSNLPDWSENGDLMEWLSEL